MRWTYPRYLLSSPAVAALRSRSNTERERLTKGIEMNRIIASAVVACMVSLCSCSGHEDSMTAVSRDTQTEDNASTPIKSSEFKVEATNSAIVQAAQQAISSQAPMQSRHQTQSNLSSESLVLQAGSVSTEKVGNLLQSERFDAFVSRLSAESNKNHLAQDVTAIAEAGARRGSGDGATGDRPGTPRRNPCRQRLRVSRKGRGCNPRM